MTIQSHTQRSFMLALAFAVITACAPAGEAPTAASSADKRIEAKPKVETPRAVTPAVPRRAPRPKANNAPRDGLHLLRTTGSVEGPLPYTLVGPSDDAPNLPIVLALHGRGDRAEGFSRLVEGLRLPFRFVVAEAPMRWGLSSGKSWFDMNSPERSAQIAARVSDIMALTKKVKARWPEAPQPALLGFSQGAMLALQVIATHPESFKGAVALSGSLLEPDVLKPTTSGRPVLLSAGKRDQIVPMVRSESASRALRELGHDTELFVFEGGHRVTKPVVAKVQAALTRWLSPSGGSASEPKRTK